jgi:hypothetical protein
MPCRHRLAEFQLIKWVTVEFAVPAVDLTYAPGSLILPLYLEIRSCNMYALPFTPLCP